MRSSQMFIELACVDDVSMPYVDPDCKWLSSCSAESEGYRRLRFVDGLNFLRLRCAMQADFLRRLVSQGNANKETSNHLVANTACKRDETPKWN